MNNSSEQKKNFLTVHHGTHHKKMHGYTTLATIPLALWAMYSMFMLRDATYGEFVAWFQTPLNAVIAMFFVCITFKHFALELQVVFEDYISDVPKRNAVIIFTKLLFALISVVTMASLAKLALF